VQELSSAALRRSLSEKLFCFSFFASKVLQLGRGKLQRLPLQRPGKSQLAVGGGGVPVGRQGNGSGTKEC